MKENEYKKKFHYFRRRLNIEAGIRAGTIGLAAGLFGAAVMLLYGRLRYQELRMTGAGITAVVVFVLVVLLGYILWFRPRKKVVLQRIDAMGLKERMITMEEFKQVETVLAEKQRLDTKEHLSELDTKKWEPRIYIIPLICCAALAILVGLLILLPISEQPVDAQAEQNALELQLLDELIASLRSIIDSSEVNTTNKSELHEIVDALAVSFLPEDTTLTRTAKIATASKRLDMLAASKKSEITLKKQQPEGSEAAQEEIKELEKEQNLLESTIREMKDAMGTSINVLTQTEGIFWTPIGPSSKNSKEEEPLPEEESVISEDILEALEPLKGGMTSDSETQQENANTASNSGEEMIYDPEHGEISYGIVFEEYYQEILNALTEKEISEEMREIIEDYANSLE